MYQAKENMLNQIVSVNLPSLINTTHTLY